MKNKKNNKWIVVLILLLFLAGIGGYFGYQYFQKAEEERLEKEKQEEEEEITKIPLNASQQDYVLSKISFYDGMLPYGAFTAKTLPEDRALQFIDSIRDIEYIDFTRGLRISKIKEILGRYFGSSVSFKGGSSTCNDPNTCFIYDSENERYQKASVATYPIKSKNFYLEGTQDKKTKEVVIQVHQLYYIAVNEGDYPVQYYKTPEEALQNINPIFDLENLYRGAYRSPTEYTNYVNKAYETIKSSLSPVTYHFEYESSRYYLESVVK